MSAYAERIESAMTLEELENIVEEAADDEWITNEDYCAVYAKCVEKLMELGREVRG